MIDSRRRSGKSAKTVLTVTIVLNLALMGFFKYTGFIVDSLKALIPALSSLAVPEIALPIGISFYIFQSMSYTIDVYRSDAPVQRDPVGFGTYVAMFPQLIAGPIVKYKDVAEQLSCRRESVEKFASGIRIFIIGLAKNCCWQTRWAFCGKISAYPGGHSLPGWACWPTQCKYISIFPDTPTWP